MLLLLAPHCPCGCCCCCCLYCQVRLSACDLASIYSGTVTDWASLPFNEVPVSSPKAYHANITVYGYAMPTSHRYVLSK